MVASNKPEHLAARRAVQWRSAESFRFPDGRPIVPVGWDGRGLLVKFVCFCGKPASGYFAPVRRGSKRSCGCIWRWHKMTGRPTWRSWHSMIERCYSSNHKSFADYGGRGIAVCEHWKSFINFLAEMGERPKGKTLGRIDNSAGYFKENCEWQTAIEQGSNKRNNVILEFNGECKTMAEWARFIGISPELFRWRHKHGWTMDQILTTRPDCTNRRK